MILLESHRSSLRLFRRAEQRNPACGECYLIGNRETIWLFAMEECWRRYANAASFTVCRPGAMQASKAASMMESFAAWAE